MTMKAWKRHFHTMKTPRLISFHSSLSTLLGDVEFSREVESTRLLDIHILAGLEILEREE